MAARLLVSGFEPFAGMKENPTEALVARLAGRPPPGTETAAVVLPTVFGECARVLLERIESFGPTHVVLFGLGRELSRIHVERFALNLADTDGSDNAGNAPREAPVVPGGPIGYFATLPVRSMVTRLRAHGLDACLSTGAGTFVCNDLFYRTLHALAARSDPPVCGFVHVPAVRQMPGSPLDAPTMEALEEGIRGALEVIL